VVDAVDFCPYWAWSWLSWDLVCSTFPGESVSKISLLALGEVTDGSP
jgi:hypothetical protein